MTYMYLQLFKLKEYPFELTPDSDFLFMSKAHSRAKAYLDYAIWNRDGFVVITGEVGAGKTTLVQGLAQGWGSLDAVSSPTFILVNVYRRPDENRLFHLDAYRLESAPEAEELDLDTMLAQGPLVIEWPERLESILPEKRLWIALDYMTEEHRKLAIKAQGERYDHLLADLRQSVFGVG